MMGGRTFDVEIASQVPVIARLDRAIQKLAQLATWIIRSSRMITRDRRQREIILDSLYHCHWEAQR